jgi:hypothetical protein
VGRAPTGRDRKQEYDAAGNRRRQEKRVGMGVGRRRCGLTASAPILHRVAGIFSFR